MVYCRDYHSVVDAVDHLVHAVQAYECIWTHHQRTELQGLSRESLRHVKLAQQRVKPRVLQRRRAPNSTMTDIAKFEQFGLNAFYNAIPTLDNANDWFKWNRKVNEFIRISAVAEDETTLPIEEEDAQQWNRRQKYAAMITAKLTHNAAQRINAFEIHQVQPLLKAVKENFKPEGSGSYVNLQRRYMSLTREKCGSTQALGAEIRRIHAEKPLLDPDSVTWEIERTFFMHALGAEYDGFCDYIFRQMDLVNDRDADGNVIKASGFEGQKSKVI